MFHNLDPIPSALCIFHPSIFGQTYRPVFQVYARLPDRSVLPDLLQGIFGFYAEARLPALWWPNGIKWIKTLPEKSSWGSKFSQFSKLWTWKNGPNDWPGRLWLVPSHGLLDGCAEFLRCNGHLADPRSGCVAVWELLGGLRYVLFETKLTIYHHWERE